MKFFGVLLLLSSAHAFAGDLPPIRYAADAESGAPFAFYHPNDPKKLVGFEVEIIEAIARKLGRKTQFVQTAWEGLIPGLSRGEYDLVINGMEVTSERELEVSFSEPYYLTYLQLVGPSSLSSELSISDFKGKRIGTLSGALSEKVLRSHTDIEIVAYTHETHARGDLLSGNRLDAVLLDAPMVTYYFAPEARLKVLGPPLGSLTYAMAFRKADSALRAEVNRALQELKTSGELREILERWNLWSASLMADHLQDRSPPRSAPTEYQSFVTATRGERSWRERLSLYGSFLPILLRAALVTFSISLASMVLAVVSGLLLAILRLYGGRLPGGAVLSIGAGVWIELIRGTPLLLQLFFIFYALPHFGIHLSPWVAAILGLGLNYGAAEAENYRAGILSVPKGQWEAAQALGFKQTQALTHIVIPQGVRLVIPSMTNDFIALLKDSSLVSVITMVELTKAYSQLSSTYYDYIGPALMACVLYLLMGLPFVRIAKYAEEKLSRGYGAHAG